MRLGFIGTGTISAAIVEGLLRGGQPFDSIHLSPRNEQIAGRLAARDARIKVAGSNQAVLDFSDVVVLAIRPQIAEPVLTELRFSPHQHVISLIATAQTTIIARWVEPAGRVTRAIPLPFVERCNGMTAIYPPDPIARDLFEATGSTIEAESEAELDLFLAASAMMGPYFQLLSGCNDWLTRNGLSDTRARIYLNALFASLSDTAAAKSEISFADLQAEFSTPGGLNEQLARQLNDDGTIEALSSALDAVHARISKARSSR